MISADQTKIPDKTWAVGVLRKSWSSPTTSVPLLDLIMVMLDMSVMFDSIENDNKGTELSMFLSESTDRVLKFVVVDPDSFICRKNKKINKIEHFSKSN